MATVKYIDPEFKKALEGINPVIRKETGYSFDIARRIGDILAAKHWSQADLARATGKTRPLVSRWLSGTHNFTIHTIAEIENALGQPIITVSKTKISRAVRGYHDNSNKPLYLSDNREGE